MLKLVHDQKWTLLATNKDGIEIYHRDYENGLHGLVFIDKDGIGNAVLMEGDEEINSTVTEIPDMGYLKEVCDTLIAEIDKAV